jgi:hypothetical protein
MNDGVTDDEHFRASWAFEPQIGGGLRGSASRCRCWPIIDGKLAQLVEDGGICELRLPSTWTLGHGASA